MYRSASLKKFIHNINDVLSRGNHYFFLTWRHLIKSKMADIKLRIIEDTSHPVLPKCDFSNKSGGTRIIIMHLNQVGYLTNNFFSVSAVCLFAISTDTFLTYRCQSVTLQSSGEIFCRWRTHLCKIFTQSTCVAGTSLSAPCTQCFHRW